MSAGNTIPPELRTALRLLARALSGKADLQAGPAPPDARELSVSLKRTPHKVLTVRLLPWEEGGESKRGTTTVWVLSPRHRAEAPRLRQRDESFVDLRGAVHLVL
ncbi:MAG TPA: hypothetical protein VLK84_11030, partial [Longimicrobium sp.]|nr:hypothetical protein [Longimicrobium sp.]